MTTETPIHRFSHEAMATVNTISICCPDSRYAAQAAPAAFREIDRIENLLSRFIPGSDISRINGQPPGTVLPIAPETRDCLLICNAVSRMTGGAFNADIGALTARASGTTAMTGVSPGRIPVSPDSAEIIIPATGLNLDLGAVGKGYALDKAAEILEEWEVSKAMLNSGGSTVLALDAPQGRPGWTVTCGSDEFELVQGAASGSGMSVQPGHIVDPRSGTPAPANRRCRALAPTAAIADALSTAAMVMNRQELEHFERLYPEVRLMVEII